MKKARGANKKSITNKMTKTIQVTAVKLFLVIGGTVLAQYGQANPV